MIFSVFSEAVTGKYKQCESPDSYDIMLLLIQQIIELYIRKDLNQR